MDCQDQITSTAERKRGRHLQREDRGANQHLKNQGYANRAIAREIGCSPTTVGNGLRRGMQQGPEHPVTLQSEERRHTKPTEAVSTSRTRNPSPERTEVLWQKAFLRALKLLQAALWKAIGG